MKALDKYSKKGQSGPQAAANTLAAHLGIEAAAGLTGAGLAGGLITPRAVAQMNKADDVGSPLWNALMAKAKEKGVRVDLKNVDPLTEGFGPHYVTKHAPFLENKGSVQMQGNKSAPVLAHELGHATGRLKDKLVRPSTLILSRLAGAGAGLGALHSTYKGLRSGDDKERDDRLKKGRNLAVAGGLAIGAPTLLEETRANIRGMNLAKSTGHMKRRAYLKAIGLPYLGYVSQLALPALLTGGGLELLRRGLKKKADEKKEKKASAKRDPRLERAGVSGYNKPKRTPGHPTKSHIVVAKEGDRIKTIRFGQQGVKTNQTAGQREAFKSRHRKNIAKGRMSAAYWADKAKWSPSKTKDKDNKKWVKGTKTAAIADASPAKQVAETGGHHMHDGHNHTPRSLNRLQKRFRAISRNLDRHGAVTNPLNPHLKRIAFDKSKLSEDQIKRLGFKQVLIAIPEKGQKSFKTYRHPVSNHHIHDHGGSWVMHKDKHSAMPMIMERLKLKREGRLKDTKSPTGRKQKGIHTPDNKAQGLLSSMEHLVGEGARGLAGYAKSVVSGGEDVLSKTTAGTTAAGKRAIGRLKDLAKSPLDQVKTKESHVNALWSGKGGGRYAQ